MEYVLTDGKRYASKIEPDGPYTTTWDRSMAKLFESPKAAGKALKGSVGRFGDGFQIRRVDRLPNGAGYAPSPCELPFDIADKADEITGIVSLIEKRRDYLTDELALIDLELSDIEHAAEFYELNASRGYKLYRMLHDARVRRRAIKDELTLCAAFLGSTVKGLGCVRKKADGFESRAYIPRVNKELFEV